MKTWTVYFLWRYEDGSVEWWEQFQEPNFERAMWLAEMVAKNSLSGISKVD